MRGPPRRAEGRITSLSQQLLPTLPSPQPPRIPLPTSLTGLQVLLDRSYWASGPHPIKHQPSPSVGAGGLVHQGGPPSPLLPRISPGGSRMADHRAPSSHGHGPGSASRGMVQLPDLRGCFHLLLGPGSSCGGRAKGGSPPTPCSNHRPAPGARPAGPLSLHQDFPGPEMFMITLLGHLV